MALRLPGFEWVDLGPDGGPYDDTSKPKLGWHTTEGTSLAGAEPAFKNYPPHLGVDPVRGHKRQYVDLLRHAYAFAGSESDDEYIIQVEVCGFAGQSHNWSDGVLKWLGENVVKPLRDTVGIPDVVIRHGFRGEGGGIILASPDSPIRIGAAELRAFSGHLGHQHMPSPDSHWDPGALPIGKILAHSRPVVVVPPVIPELEEHMTIYAKGSTKPDIWCFTSDGTAITGRHVTAAEWNVLSKAEGVKLTPVSQAAFDALVTEVGAA